MKQYMENQQLEEDLQLSSSSSDGEEDKLLKRKADVLEDSQLKIKRRP